MKKFIRLISFFCTVAFFSTILSSCKWLEKVFEKWKELSTLEELENTYADDNIRLMSDIDCEYMTISAINCKKFDGQGHTIKNCLISTTDNRNSASFFEYSEEVENVIFDNITIKAPYAASAAVVCVGGAKKINNVHVRNSKVSCGQCIAGTGLGRTVKPSYVGGIYGGCYRNEPVLSFDCEITNCSIEDSKIELNGYENYNNTLSSGANMYGGGIAGGCNNISNCSVTNCKIEATSTETYNYPYIGGIVGYSEGKIENTSSKNNEFKASSTHYQASMLTGFGSSTIYAGGIVAYSKGDDNIKYCGSEDISLTLNSTGKIYAGGIGGYIEGTTVSQSYVNSISITMSGYSDSANSLTSSAVRRAGGLIGSSYNNSIQNCFTYACNINETSTCSSDNESKAAGLIAGFTSISVMYCATNNSKLNDNNSTTINDEFIPAEVSKTNYCYVSSSKYGNANKCEVVENEFWFTPSIIRSKLNLMGSYWKFVANEIPSLVFE